MMKSPEEQQDRVPEHNPIGKIPTLVLDDGTILYDSRVIAEYLDNLHDGEKLIPLPGGNRWDVLRLQALGDAIGDAAVMVGMEYGRSEDCIREPFAANHLRKITRSTQMLEDDMDILIGPLNVGHIAVACGLGYVDFRLVDFNWREDRPNLATWANEFSMRPSMQETFFARPEG